MRIGYVRVSTVSQNEERQIKSMNDHNVEKIFIDKSSGSDIQNRIQLKTMLDFVREGDIVFVHDFSRLARSVKDLLQIVEILNKKNVSLISFKENIDSGTSTGKLMLTMIAAIYEFERANILERQQEGIALAKLHGKYKGRKPITKPENWDFIYRKWKNREITGVEARKILNLKHSTFYKFIKEEKNKCNNLLHEKEETND